MDPSLYKAAIKGEIEPFKEIANDQLERLGTSRNKKTVLRVNIAFQKPLRREEENQSTEFVKQTLETCPSLLLQVNDKGDAPVHVAAKCGNAAVVKVLIEFAEKQPKLLESGVETARQMLGLTNEEGNTAFHEAVQCGRLDVVKLLMEAVPNLPYSANVSCQTPLYMAAAKAHREMVADILEKCPLAAHEP